jgi:hypothetical protein
MWRETHIRHYVVNCGSDALESELQSVLETMLLHKNFDHNSPHVSAMYGYIPPHTSNNFYLLIFYNQCYFSYSTFNQNCTILKLLSN